jgi:hypothetical protein
MPEDNCSEIQDPIEFNEYRLITAALRAGTFRDDFASFLETRGYRINWDYHIYAGTTAPQADKRITIWVREGNEPVWRIYYEWRARLHICAYDRSGQVIPLVGTGQRQVFVQDGAIVFKGGYLEVHDPGLYAPLEHLIPQLKQKRPVAHNTNIFTPFVRTKPENFGRSIHLEADFSEQAQSPLRQPLFYFPQDDNYPAVEIPGAVGAVFLGVEASRSDGGERRLVWAISGETLRSTPYDVGQNDMRHTLSVSVDNDWLGNYARRLKGEPKKAPWFELLVDAIGLSDASGVAVPDEIDFGTHKRKFTIGCVPSNDDTGLRKAGWTSTFHGRLYDLIFDPNTHCNGC